MTDKEALYKAHLDDMFGVVSVDEFSFEKVDAVLARLLQCLPNDGKLYKYRSIEGQAFDYAYDGLEQGYLYMARASSLNDDLDSTLIFDPEKEVKETADYFFSHPWLYLENWVKTNSDQPLFRSAYDYHTYQKAMECVDRENYTMDIDKAVEQMVALGATKEQARKYIEKLNALTDGLIEQHKAQVEGAASAFINFNQNNRENVYVFSMSEDFDSNSMWGLYANSNKGFCIEYDYNKLLKMPYEIKRRLINLYRVVYEDQLGEYSFMDMHKYMLTGKTNLELFRKANMEMLTKMITKHSDWQAEKEWRIFLCNLDDNNKIYADLVSGVIIDERVIQEPNALKLIELCRKRGWTVKVRKKNRTAVNHVYEELR